MFGDAPQDVATRHLRALTEFLRGKAGLSELKEALEPVVSLNYEDPSSREVRFEAPMTGPAIVFSRRDVCTAIDRFLSFEITDEELSDWGATIRLFDCYDLDPMDENADAV